MRKEILWWLAVAVVAHGLLGSVWRSRQADRQAIAGAQAAAEQLEHERDSLVDEVEDRRERQAALVHQRAEYEAQASAFRDSIEALERARTDGQLDVRQIRTSGQLLDRLRATFPELVDSAWGTTTVRFDDADTLGLEYLMVPAWFAETFAIDRQNALSWEQQKDRLLATDSLQLLITLLQDSVIRLVAANATAYASGYETAYANYQTVSDLYVAELARPRIQLGPAIGLLGAVGIGVMIGRSSR